MDQRALGSEGRHGEMVAHHLGGRSYQTRAAAAGYAPDPEWGKLPPWKDLVVAGFGEHGIIGDKNHPIYRDQMGEKPEKPAGDLSGDDLTDDDL